MVNVRNVKCEADYEDYEYSQFCQKCDKGIAVLPPTKLIKDIINDNDNSVYDWLDKHYFYCPECQKKFDYPAFE